MGLSHRVDGAGGGGWPRVRPIGWSIGRLIRLSHRVDRADGGGWPGALYFHRSSTGQVPPLIRLILLAATQIVGDVDHDLVKLDSDGRKVSFLRYSRFDEEAHPALEYSVRVHLPTATHSFRDYRDSLNPPILHRKDSLVDPLYPRYADFRALTEQEQALCLLSRNDIGFRRQWLALLAEKRVRIDGHTLITEGDGVADV